MKIIVTVVLLFSIIISCSTRTSKKPEEPFEEYEIGAYDQWWEKDLSGEDIEIYSKSPKDQLRYAKHAASEGDYKTAIKTYLKLYQIETIDSEIGQQALLNLGYNYGNILNPYKNYERAIYFLEKLLSEFPQTKFRSNPEQSIRNIHKLMKN